MIPGYRRRADDAQGGKETPVLTERSAAGPKREVLPGRPAATRRLCGGQGRGSQPDCAGRDRRAAIDVPPVMLDASGKGT